MKIGNILSLLNNRKDNNTFSAYPLRDFIVLDVETSGFNPELNRIIEIGALKISEGSVVDTFQTLVKYKGNLKPQIQTLTGIRQEKLRSAPERTSAFSNFFEFIEDHTLVGHNIIEFDNKFLWFNALDLGLQPKKNGLLDTLILSKKYIAASSYKLSHLCSALNISTENTHRALDDATLTLKLYNKLYEHIDISRDIVHKEYTSQSSYRNRVDPETVSKTSHIHSPKISGKLFCITTFVPFGIFNKEIDLIQFIVNANGTVSSSLNQKVDFLIDCDPKYISIKEKKAIELIKNKKSNIKIVTPEDFISNFT